MKDHHAILGVHKSAGIDEIIAAYRRRVKVVHPDRFNSTEQKEEWEQANRMLQELNDAFKYCKAFCLSGGFEQDIEPPKNEAEKAANKEQASKTESQPKTNYTAKGVIVCQEVHLSPGQIAFIQSLLHTSATSYVIKAKLCVLSVLMLVLSFCTYVYVMIDWASLSTVKLDNFIIGLLLILVLNFVSTASAMHLYAYSKLKIKPCLILTPLYIIHVGIHNIYFAYLWEISSISCYREKFITELEFKIGTEKIIWRDILDFDLSKVRKVLSAFDDVRFSIRNFTSWLNANDILRHIHTEAENNAYKHLLKALLIGCVLCVFSALALTSQFTIISNHDVKQQEIAKYASRQPEMPPPAPAPPNKTTVSQIVTSPQPPTVPYPRNGHEWITTTKSCVAPLHIVVPRGSNHYFIKVYETETGKVVKSIYLRPGSTAETNMPVGSYTLKYAYGTEWYGRKFLFGADTKVGIVDKTLSFFSDGHQYHGHTIELILREDGNLPTRAGVLSDF